MDNSNMLDHTAEKYLTIQEKLQQRGKADVTKTTTYKTPLMLAFGMVNTNEVYLLQKKFVDTFECIQKDDTSFVIKEILGENLWSNPDEIPSGKEFEGIFRVKSSTNCNRH
eukprot:14884333-Ditylum_brightwellii.AAC.1